jgi:hypothetical protein
MLALQFAVRIGDISGVVKRVPLVSISDVGSLNTAQWNFVREHVTRSLAKVEC